MLMFIDKVSMKAKEGHVQHAIKATKLGITVNVYALRREQNQNFPQWAQVMRLSSS
jgi:hypothetical protein